MCKVYLNYINGDWSSGSNGETIPSVNPANTDEIVGYVQSSTVVDVNIAVKSAKSAQKKWENISSVQRGNILHKVANVLEARTEDIAVTATKEMGKTLAETTGELARAVSILRFYAQEGLRKTGDVIPSQDNNNLLYTTRVSLGVVGVISPWNFPIAIPVWKIAPALVFGNTVVFKPATETAITAVKIAEAFHEGGIPKGVFNLVTGKGSVIGDALIENESIDGISFTGSNVVGKKVALGAIERGAKYQLEMGGKNPAIVMDDADLDVAEELTVNAAMKHTGQKCTATSIVYVHCDIYDEFKERILKRVHDIKVGSGIDPSVYMGPLSSRNQLEGVMKYIEKGIEEGGKLIYGGKRMEGLKYDKGYFIEPTVFENVSKNMTIAREEIFGPVLALIKIESLEDALTQANESIFGLSSSIFTRDLAKSLQFVKEIQAGMVKVNGESAGVEPQAPFGGMKQSSSGSREQGTAAIEFFTSIKTITITPLL
ncbi:aldehyde dehydrogenase family protein [Salipaludibacillus neizhouensis]|uniref:Aldehyde dehydrogenase family protein n=1 Tax=Salipaludibacillus neizhouensis TaxID=885475 RepID=A0A3A9JXV7_9BACI|nr:alpha-ketoglutaric semialdehyde dehydrogenase GucD [Salipaludibacillus neizhouensis]RKL65039.1 aldehyde dehydrogenase family protein [Salipaludibacillus neizhouensis]